MILYAELLNRTSLSQKNDMIDEFGNVYVIYPIDQLSKRLNLSETQIKRLIKELVNEGLLQKRSGGFNKPNHLFVILPGEQKGTTGETKRDRCFPSRIQHEWTFENDNGRNSKMQVAKNYVANWNEMKKNGLGLLLWGSVGSGKSYLM